MPKDSRRPGNGPDRRTFLSLLGAGLAAGGASVRRAARAPKTQTLQALIEQNQRRELGQDFDSASRTIHMPKASLPTLSPSTVRHHRPGDRAIREHPGARRLARTFRPPTAAARQPPPQRRAAAPAADRSPAISKPLPASPISSIPMSRRRCAASRPATASPSTASCARKRFDRLNIPCDGAARLSSRPIWCGCAA